MNDFFDDKSKKDYKNYSKEEEEEEGTSSQLTSSSVLLFLNQLIVAFGNWIFWMLISKLTSPEQIGQSTTIYSMVLLFTTIIQLGLEYPILKYSYRFRKFILSTTFIIEIVLSLAFLPLLIIIFDSFENENLVQFEILAIIMIFLTVPWYITHFLLLGLFRVRTVLIIDILATISKFVIGFVLVSIGWGALGILLAFVAHIFILGFFGLYITRTELNFKIDKKIFKVFFREGIVNAPSRISRIFIFSLSVVLLALFGIDAGQIGIFYMAVTISIVAGGFATNIALMVIPASVKSNKEIAPSGLRIGLSFTMPFVILLVTYPQLVLSLIGDSYIAASNQLAILGLSILPASITIIAISEFNTTHQLKKILIIGITEISTFLISFSLLVPSYGISGAAFATLIAFSISAIISVLWINRISVKYIINSVITLITGLILWNGLMLFLGDDYWTLNLLVIIIILIISTIMIFHMNRMTLSEIREMFQVLYKRRS